MVLYVERCQTFLYSNPDYYVMKANDYDIAKLCLKSNADRDFGLTNKLTGKFFFRERYSGMVLYVEYNGLVGQYIRKADEMDIVNLKLYR